MNHKNILITLFLIFSSIYIAVAQNPEDKEKDYRGFITAAPRFGVGIHNYINAEIGISALYIDNETLEFGAASAYFTVILQQTNWSSNKYSSGWKLGIQSSWAIFMWGIEVKSLSYENQNYNYISPKFGLSWMDVLNIEYAINVMDTEKEMPIDSRHQISINFSINKKIYKECIKSLF